MQSGRRQQTENRSYISSQTAQIICIIFFGLSSKFYRCLSTLIWKLKKKLICKYNHFAYLIRNSCLLLSPKIYICKLNIKFLHMIDGACDRNRTPIFGNDRDMSGAQCFWMNRRHIIETECVITRVINLLSYILCKAW